MNLLAQMSWGQWLFAVTIIGICLLLMLVILLQKGRGGGLAGAFGGGGGSSAFGAKTGDVFTWITVIVAAVFILLAIGANFAFDQSEVVSLEVPAGATGFDIPLDGEGSFPGSAPGTTLLKLNPDGTIEGAPEGGFKLTFEGDEKKKTDRKDASGSKDGGSPEKPDEDPGRP